MKHAGFILLYIVSAAFSVYAKPNLSAITAAYDNLDKEVVIKRMESSIKMMYDYQQNQYLPRFYEALSNYSSVFVLHTSIDLKRYFNNGEIVLMPEDSCIPYDIVFYSKKYEIKTIAKSDNGKVSYVDSYHSFAKGYAKKYNRLLKRILNENHQFILRCEEFPDLFLVVDNKQVKAYDIISGEYYRLEDYLVSFFSKKKMGSSHTTTAPNISQSSASSLVFSDKEGNTIVLYKDYVFVRLKNQDGVSSYELFYGEGNLIWGQSRKKASLRLFNNSIDTLSMDILTNNSDVDYAVFTVRGFDESPIESAIITLFDHNDCLLFVAKTDKEGKVIINNDAVSKCFKIHIECNFFNWQRNMFFATGTNTIFRYRVDYPYTAMYSGLKLDVKYSNDAITFCRNKIKYVLHKSECKDTSVSALLLL